jgi:Tol biopolymer transport system component
MSRMGRSAKAAIAAMALCALAAGPAQAAFPGQNGKIAFDSSYLDEVWGEIYAIDPDGTGRVRLTASEGIDIEPAWSPDGRQVAFTSARAGSDPTCQSTCNLDVYVMNADGSRVQRLTDDPARDREPAWSPDSSQIVFTSTRGDVAGSDLYVMNADGTNQTRITAFPLVDKHPAWSPDGARIAYFRGDCAFNCTSHIYTAAPDGSDVSQLTFGDFVRDRTPDWSPDGSRVVFNREVFQNQFWIVNRDGSNPTAMPGTRLEPAWSPDGTRIAHGAPGVGYTNLDGSDPRLVFANGSRPDWQPLVGPQRADYKTRPDFCLAELEFLGSERFRAVYRTFGGCVSSS